MSVELAEVLNLVEDLPGVIVQKHFHKLAFKLNKKIFMTLDESVPEVVLKLTVDEQDYFSELSGSSIRPVTGYWGTKGWTSVNLEGVSAQLFKKALLSSYRQKA